MGRACPERNTVHGLAFISRSGGFIAQQRGIAGEVRSHEITVLAAPHAIVLQSVFKARYLAGLAVAEQPVVGVASVVALEHDADVVINRIPILQGLARAYKFGF